jgi:hypothetical protein
MTQQEKTNLQTVRSVIENGSKKLGIPITSDKLDEFATFYANNVDTNTGRLDGQAQNQALTILGITMEQSEKIMRAGRQ